jgi:hypothetical protein
VQVRRDRGGVIDTYGIIGPGILAYFVIVLIGFWPALVWHGYTGTGGWRWDVHSTIGCCIWWGLTIVPVAVACIIEAARKRTLAGAPVSAAAAVSKAQAVAAGLPAGFSVAEELAVIRAELRQQTAQKPPVCLHLGAVRVESSLDNDQTLAWLCPGCGTQLPEGFGNSRRPCCGTAPEFSHWVNCPHREPRP